MSAVAGAVPGGRAGIAQIDAALVMLDAMGVTAADLAAAAAERRRIPTFTEFLPQVCEIEGPAHVQAWERYWAWLIDEWGRRPITEPTTGDLVTMRRRVQTRASKS